MKTDLPALLETDVPKFWNPANKAYIVLSIPLVHNLLVSKTIGKNACMPMMGAMMLSPSMYIHLSGIPMLKFHRFVKIISNIPAHTLKKVVNMKILRMFDFLSFHWNRMSPKTPKNVDTSEDPNACWVSFEE